MPNSSLTDAIKEAYASAPTDTVILHTLEFRHSAFTQPLRVVYDNRQWSGYLEADAPEDGGQLVNFSPYTFEIKLPEVTDSGLPELEIKIDNVTQEIQEQIEAAAVTSEQVELTYRPFLSSDVNGSGYLNGPQMDPPMHLVITFIKADVLKITATASFGDISNKLFPVEIYTPDNFPGLVR